MNCSALQLVVDSTSVCGNTWRNSLLFKLVLQQGNESKKIGPLLPTKTVRKRPLAKDSEPANGDMLLGYARVSKGDEQNNALQANALRAAGCRKLFEEAVIFQSRLHHHTRVGFSV